MYTRNEKIVPINLEDEMKDSYINYAMSVIVGRALPDVRDGLKPVHRRVLYAMSELHLEHNKTYKKCARIVGEVLGKYHPHGDTAVYDSLVRMAQDFSLRYPLVDGQGNFGSVDGDRAAAMRYTEAKMQKISSQMLLDIDKETVNFVPNFDESLLEPTVLPSAIPNLLINGSSGIAVGMATNIPPHNLNEIVDAACFLIDQPECAIKDLIKFVKGPDFPTGGIICGQQGIKDAYTTGRGKILVHAKANIEQQKNGKERIVITEIPYQVNKTNLIQAIVNLVTEKKAEGISDIRDESDKEGMRLVIEIKKGQNAEVVLNQLYKKTQMQETFGIIMLALDNNRPKILNLKEMLSCFLEHRKEIVIRRTQFDLSKAEARAHILEGLKIAIKFLDEVIKVIRKAETPIVAKEELILNFKLSALQAQAILEMQLQKITNLERGKIDDEYKDLIKKIAYFREILGSETKMLAIIKAELIDIKEKYGDARRTAIVGEHKDLEIEDLIAEEDMVITISHAGYIKRLPMSLYKQQKRGGKGISGSGSKEEDFSEHLFIASTHDYILFFTDLGKVYWLKVHEIPQTGRLAKGRAIINLLSLENEEQITSFIPVRDFKEGQNLLMATKNGIVKKTALTAFSNPRKGGIIAITLDKDDKLVSTVQTDGSNEVLIATKEGMAIRFNEKNIREMGRSAKGVIGIRLSKKDQIIDMVKVSDKGALLVVTAKGYGKRSDFDEYRLQSRGGKGIINIKITEKNGKVVGMKTVEDKHDIMVISSQGMIVRTPVNGIRIIGRSTQGVKIINLKTEDRVSSIATIIAEEEGEEE
ncbi:MAG: DNA gyrase subunit A [Candidatus Omnitrophica bacterium]|nr:DNA gyrase subunit A [Candidatus Omnitrophota bacterium]